MKRIFIALIFLLAIYFVDVDARECSDKEIANLNSIVANVKINHEIIKEEFTNIYNQVIVKESIKITVYNITNQIYGILTNDVNDEKIVISSSNTLDGKYVIETDNIDSIINYSLAIYSSIDCDTVLLKRLNYIKPMKNPNFYYQLCQENPTVPVCQEYITQDTGVSDGELKAYIDRYLSGQVQTTTKPVTQLKNESFFEEYFWYIFSGFLVISLGITAYVVISKKRSAL